MDELTPENRGYVESAVAAGIYPDALTVMNEAVVLLRFRDNVRRKLQDAVEQADRGAVMASEQVWDRFEQRARRIQKGEN
jgi:hypothetical protein